ncbi:hypothetical protein D3C79_1109810 [compost metagenome]
MLQLNAGYRQLLVNNMVRIWCYVLCYLSSIRQIYKNRTAGLCPIVYTNCIFFAHLS